MRRIWITVVSVMAVSLLAGCITPDGDADALCPGASNCPDK